MLRLPTKRVFSYTGMEIADYLMDRFIFNRVAKSISAITVDLPNRKVRIKLNARHRQNVYSNPYYYTFSIENPNEIKRVWLDYSSRDYYLSPKLYNAIHNILPVRYNAKHKVWIHDRTAIHGEWIILDLDDVICRKHNRSPLRYAVRIDENEFLNNSKQGVTYFAFDRRAKKP